MTWSVLIKSLFVWIHWYWYYYFLFLYCNKVKRFIMLLSLGRSRKKALPCGFAADERCVSTLLESSFTAGRASLREYRERSLLFENEREGCVKLFFINIIEKQMMKKKKKRVWSDIIYIIGTKSKRNRYLYYSAYGEAYISYIEKI